jgi:hypothetical protein
MYRLIACRAELKFSRTEVLLWFRPSLTYNKSTWTNQRNEEGTSSAVTNPLSCGAC